MNKQFHQLQEISKDEIKKLFPINKSLDDEYLIEFPPKKWHKILFDWLPPELKKRFFSLANKSHLKLFLTALEYEYGLNGKSIDVIKAYNLYKYDAIKNNCDLSCYKMFQIHLYESLKFKIVRNRLLEHFYLYKCLAYTNYQILRGNDFYSTSLLKEVKFHFEKEDPDYMKAKKLLNWGIQNPKYFESSSLEIDFILTMLILKFSSGEEGHSNKEILKKIADEGLNEAIYKYASLKSDTENASQANQYYELCVKNKIYKAYGEYGRFLYEIQEDYEKSLNIFEEGINNGNIYCYFCYFDNFFWLKGVQFLFECQDKNIYIKLFDMIINDIILGGIFSYYEFFYLRKIVKKYFKPNFLNDILRYIDPFSKDLVFFLQNIIKKENKNLINELFSSEIAEVEFNLVNSYLYYLGDGLVEQNLEKANELIYFSFANSNSKSYKRFCSSILYKINKKLNKLGKTSDYELDLIAKELFNSYYIALNENKLEDLSSSYFYYLGKLVLHSIGCKEDKILCYGFNIHSYNNKVKTLGTGSILSFWRKYKSEKLLNSSIFKEIQKEIKDLNVDKSSSGYGEHNLCPICFEKERNIVLIPCKHLFCESCFKLFENEFKCPLCRGKIIISKKF